MINIQSFKKYSHLHCEFCPKKFKSRQSKSIHIRMNRCPELKKKIDAGEMEPYTKKQKVLHNSVIVRSEPEPTVFEKYI